MEKENRIPDNLIQFADFPDSGQSRAWIIQASLTY